MFKLFILVKLDQLLNNYLSLFIIKLKLLKIFV